VALELVEEFQGGVRELKSERRKHEIFLLTKKDIIKVPSTNVSKNLMDSHGWVQEQIAGPSQNDNGHPWTIKISLCSD
jgi:hypothetical protein